MSQFLLRHVTHRLIAYRLSLSYHSQKHHRIHQLQHECAMLRPKSWPWALQALPRLPKLSTQHYTFGTTPSLPAKPLPPRLKINDADLTVSYLKGTGPGGQKIVRTHMGRILWDTVLMPQLPRIKPILLSKLSTIPPVLSSSAKPRGLGLRMRRLRARCLLIRLSRKRREVRVGLH